MTLFVVHLRNVMKLVGYRLKKVRENLDWSQEKLGQAVGVSKQQIAKWEDAGDNLKVVTVKKLCEAMEVDPVIVLIGVVDEEQKEGENDIDKNLTLSDNSGIPINSSGEDAMLKEVIALQNKVIALQDERDELKAVISKMEAEKPGKSQSQGRQKRA